MKKFKGNNRGFSLVELIIVVTIMSVLMIVLVPAMLRHVEKTRVTKDESAVAEVLKVTELALTDDKLYTEAGGVDITVTVKDDTELSVVCGTGADPNAAGNLKADIQATIGDKIRFSSARYKGKTFTLYFEYDEDRQAYIVQPNASDATIKWTVS